MKASAENPKPKKVPKSLDDEIAALQEKLARLQEQKREKERKDLERNQKAIATMLRNEKLDTVPIDRWTSALPALRKLLKAEPWRGAASPAPTATPRPEQTSGQASSGQSGSGKSAHFEEANVVGQTS